MAEIGSELKLPMEQRFIGNLKALGPIGLVEHDKSPIVCDNTNKCKIWQLPARNYLISSLPLSVYVHYKKSLRLYNVNKLKVKGL